MEHHSRLFYHGTNVEVMLGDHILLTRGLLIKRQVPGVVCYMPGVSPPHPEMEWDSGNLDWAISLEDGEVWAWLYLPDRLRPSKRIQFLYRGDPEFRGLMPTDPLN